MDKADKDNNDFNKFEEQKFVLAIVRQINKATGEVKLSMRTKGDGITLPEAAVILEGWVNKVKEKIQEPFTKDLKFGY
ncbi:MAG: hypothetical protein GWP09_01440 [Nitrospiraceae bacterium]|nr:hypothetical protein [Nitrospiraceae bacterium]